MSIPQHTTRQAAPRLPHKGKGYRRTPSDGNILWRLYQELGATAKARFRKLLEENEVPYITFNQHTRANWPLSKLRGKHLTLYRDFFFTETESRVDLYVETKRQPEKAAEEGGAERG